MRPDMGFLTKDEVLDRARSLTEAVGIPVVIDIDTGYGNAIHVEHFVRELLITAPLVAGFHIEDQVFPKRCGHIDGKEILPIDEFAGKLRAAIAMQKRHNPDAVLIARTDACNAVGGGIEEAIERSVRYSAEGADLVWAETSTPDPAVIGAIIKGARAQNPKIVFAHNTSPSFTLAQWKTHAAALSDETLAKLGCKFRFGTYYLLLAEMIEGLKWVRRFVSAGATAATLELRLAASWSEAEDIKELVGVGEHLKKERFYNARARDTQKNSKGTKE